MTWVGMWIPTVTWELFHQSAIKKYPTVMPTCQCDGGKSSVEILSSHLCLGCIKLTKTNCDSGVGRKIRRLICFPESFESRIDMMAWVRNVTHRLRYLNYWSPVDGTVYGGLGLVLLEDICTWGWSSRVKSPTYFHFTLWCELPASCSYSHAYCLLLCLPEMKDSYPLKLLGPIDFLP